MEKTKSYFHKKFDSKRKLSETSEKHIEQFQEDAKNNLLSWFNKDNKPYSGGVLAIPTGGGKTFVASRFMTMGPLFKGYKVLWLAHTHHLLEQAFETLCDEINHTKSKKKLTLRVVSGTKNHFDVKDIDKNDDVIFSTIQTITRSYQENSIHPNLEKFLEASHGNLLVVFDEAHHAPAYTYRKLILSLRERFPEMKLLGMTATPTRTDIRKGISKSEKEKLKKIKKFKDGRLKELFPQGNLYKISMDNLIALNILAEPIFEPPKHTHFDVEVTEDDIHKLKNNNKVPEHIITKLAENAPRNELIADTYAKNRDRYERTIIFADRIEQCIQICDYLEKKDVNAGYIFTHGRIEGGSYQRSDEENRKVLEDFREGNIDVIVNVRMLTEGTDVPKAKTVFLTRQTLSEILMTQMVGRALRGPKFGGKKKAYIVPFIDEWKHKILWVPPEIVKGGISVTPPSPPPIVLKELISIEAIKKVADELYTGDFVFESYLDKFIPLGWYQTEFKGIEDNGDNAITVRDLVMVFNAEKNHFEKFIQALNNLEIKDYRRPEVKFTTKIAELKGWYNDFIPNEEEPDQNLLRNLYNITCHFAQNGVEPIFFEFENREKNDLDALVKKLREIKDVDMLFTEVKNEYHKSDRYWNSIYPNEELFLKHFFIRFIPQKKIPDDDSSKGKSSSKGEGEIKLTEKDEVKKLVSDDPTIREESCENLLTIGKENDLKEKTIETLFHISRNDPDQEVRKTAQNTLNNVPRKFLTAEKKKIFKRDGNRCLCCGEKKYLQIDHIKPLWLETDNSFDNLQTLCKFCNGFKEKKTISFLIMRTKLDNKPSDTPSLKDIYYMENLKDVKNLELWEKILKRKINFYYQCSAVKEVKIGQRGYHLRNWEIELNADNNPKWVKSYLNTLAKEIRLVRGRHKLKGPADIRIVQ